MRPRISGKKFTAAGGCPYRNFKDDNLRGPRSADSEVEGRFKNALEGLGLGALTDGLVKGLKYYTKVRTAKQAGASADQIQKLASEAPVEDLKAALNACQYPAQIPPFNPSI